MGFGRCYRWIRFIAIVKEELGSVRNLEEPVICLYAHFDFSVYLPAPGTVCGRRISELAEGKDGTVWISTQDGGVCYWNPEAQTFVKSSRITGPSECVKLVCFGMI